MSNAANSILVFGDNNMQVNFIDLTAAAGIAGSPINLVYGNLVAVPVISNGIAYFGISNPVGQATFIHIVNVATATDLVPGGIQLQGSISAALCLNGSLLYAALSTGLLYVFNVSNPAKPQLVGSPFSFSQTAATVGAITIDVDGNFMYIITGAGIYTLDISNPALPIVRWSALTNCSFSGNLPLIAGGCLYVVSGITLYAFDVSISPVTNTMAPAWTWTNPNSNTLGNPIYVGYNQLLIGDSAGIYQLIGIDSGLFTASLSFAGASGISAALSLYQSQTLYFTSTNGMLYAYSIIFAVSGVSTSLLWSKSYPNTGQSAPGIFFLANQGDVLTLSGSNGTLYCINAANGVQIAAIQIPGAPANNYTSYIPAIATPTASTAALNFLLDGQTFFPTLRNLLLAVTYNTFSIQPNQLPANPNIISMLNAVSAANNDVYVLLWDLGMLRRIANGLEKIAGVNFGFNLNSNNQFVTTLKSSGSAYMHTALEIYKNANMLALFDSNHQKIIVVSVNGTKLALVSGFNLIPEYYDQQNHPDTSPNFQSWHDTGVILLGDAVTLVEKEFDERWLHYGTGTSLSATTSYVKIGYWGADISLCLDNPAVCAGTASPTPYTDPRPTGNTVSVDVLRTNYDSRLEPEIYFIPFLNEFDEFYRPLSQIRAALIQSISQANNYIYFENVAFYDTPLVQALIAKALVAGTGFQVIIMVPQPTFQDDSTQQSYNSLSKIAFISMKLAMNNWTYFTLENGQVISRSNYTGQKIFFYETAIESTAIRMDAAGGSTYFPVREIASINSNDTKFIFCGPARYFTSVPAGNNTNSIPGYTANYRKVYIHSKLALVDDTVALLGSANFTARSMYQDGELSVRITDPTTVATIRTTLFNHWGMSTAANWQSDMQSFQQTSGNSIGVLPIDLQSMATQGNLPSFLKLAITEI